MVDGVRIVLWVINPTEKIPIKINAITPIIIAGFINLFGILFF